MVSAPAYGQSLGAFSAEGVPGFGTAPGVTVLSRRRPLYDPLGVPLGLARAYPVVAESLGYDSNAAAAPGGKGSWVAETNPSLRLGADWGETSGGILLDLDDRRDLDLPADSRTDWTVASGARLGLGRDRLTLAASQRARHQGRTEIGALVTDHPVAYQVTDLRAADRLVWNRLSVTPALDAALWRFAPASLDGAPLPQAYRNRNVIAAGVTAHYVLMPLRSLVLALRGTANRYTAPQPGTPSRNSVGWSLLAGIDDASDGVWHYRLLVGWQQRDFAAPEYANHGAPVAEAAVIWSPSGLTTVTALLSRRIEDAAQEGVAGYTATTAGLTIDHEYLRNVLLRASAGLQHAVFLQGGGSQSGYALGAQAIWLVNRSLRITARYAFTALSGTGTAGASGVGTTRQSVALLTLAIAR